MRVGGLWGCGSVILMPDIGVSSRINTGEKSLRAFEVGRLKMMASEIIDIIWNRKRYFAKGIVDSILP